MAEVLPSEQIEKFMAEIFERDEHAQKAAAPKAPAILEAGSLRISDLAQTMPGTSPDAAAPGGAGEAGCHRAVFA